MKTLMRDPVSISAFHAVRAESSFEKIDDAAMLELSCLNFEQINPCG